MRTKCLLLLCLTFVFQVQGSIVTARVDCNPLGGTECETVEQTDPFNAWAMRQESTPTGTVHAVGRAYLNQLPLPLFPQTSYEHTFARVLKQADFGTGYWLVASSSIEATFALTVTLADGGTGYFIPCLNANDGTQAEFGIAHVPISTDGGGVIRDNCTVYGPPSSIPNLRLDQRQPFESGVTQYIQGSMRAIVGSPYVSWSVEVQLYSIALLDENLNLIDPSRATVQFVPIPEPGGPVFPLVIVGGLFAAPFTFRDRRRGAV